MYTWPKLGKLPDTTNEHMKFNEGDPVLVLLPDDTSKFLARWKGLYEVMQQTAPLDYEVWQLGRCKTQQICHINLFKRWVDREALFVTASLESD